MKKTVTKSVFFLISFLCFFVHNSKSQNCSATFQKFIDTYQAMFDISSDTVFECQLGIRNYPSDYVLEQIRLFVYKKDNQWVGRQIKIYWDNGYWIADFCFERFLFSHPYYNVDSLYGEVFKTLNTPQENLDMAGMTVRTLVYCKLRNVECNKEIAGNMRNIQIQYPQLFYFISWSFFESIHDGVERSIRFKGDLDTKRNVIISNE